MKKKSLKKILIISLTLVAVILALLLLKQKMGFSFDSQSQVSAIPSNWAPAPGTEREYLFSIRNDAPEEEKKKHFFYAINISKSSEYLNLTNCDPNPLVFRVKNGGTIKLKNDGDAELSIGIDASHIYVVGPKSTTTIKADLGKGTGLYGYGCNASQSPKGMIFVEK